MVTYSSSLYERYKINDLIRILCDTYFNQFPTKVRVSSTIKTEPMIVGDKFYKSYPYIRQEDIGTNTSNLFIDSLNISNLYLDGIGGITINVATTNLSNCWKLLRAS